MFKILILLSAIIYFAYVAILNIYYGWHDFSGVGSVMILMNAFVRLWETYFTSKDRKRLELHGDWTLALSSLVGIVYYFVLIADIFFFNRQGNVSFIIAGIILFALAVRLRIWGELSLGSQWSIHAVGAQKIRKIRILRIGPFKYIRHPIYLGIMLEPVALSVAFGAYFALIYSFLFFLPVMVLRAYKEELAATRRFGEAEYSKYKKSTNMFCPLNLIRSYRK